jgi:hypothetical protein
VSRVNLVAALLLISGLAGCGEVSIAPRIPSPAFTATTPDATPRRNQFPPTPSGIHLNLVFNYDVRKLSREIGVVDAVWGARSAYPKQVANQFYTPFERDGPYGMPAHSLKWWRNNHPTWIEYRCDRKHVAFEYGERDVPFDIANPDVLEYQRTGAVDPALDAGYQGIDFDNLELSNYSRRCGHYTGSGTWVTQYTGKPVDPNYLHDVLAWASATFTYVHKFSPTAVMAINFSYDSNFSAARNYDLATRTDELLDEGGFTNYGSKGHNVTTAQEWRAIVGMIHAVQTNDGCYMENGEEPSLSKEITQAERLWVVANYLLTRDDCTYVWMSGFTKSGAQDYGRILLYPEYQLAIGKATASAKAVQNAWERSYSGGLALVNPSNRRAVIQLHGNYVDENGRRYSRSITLGGETGEILLSK